MGFKIAEAYVEVKAQADRLRTEVEAKVKEAGVGQEVKVGVKIDNDQGLTIFDNLLKKVKSSMEETITSLGKGLVSIGAIGSTALTVAPAVATTVKWITDLGKASLQSAPMLAALAAGGAFVAVTMKQIGPEVVKSLSPITDGFKAAGEAAANFATKGVQQLAQQFAKSNMPAISAGMHDIADATNTVISDFLRWGKSTAGVEAIRALTISTGLAMQNLAPHVSRLVESFGNMIGRIAGVSFAAGSSGLSGVLDKLSGWMDRINAATVQTGLDTLKEKYHQVRDAIADVIEWVKKGIDFWHQYRAEIKVVQDTLSILAIAFGGPVVASAAAVGIIIRHWDDLKTAWKGVTDYLNDPAGSRFMDDLRAAVDRVVPPIKQAWDDIKNAVWPVLQEIWNKITNQLIPALGDFIAAVAPVVAYFVDKFGPLIAQVWRSIGEIISGAVSIITGILKILTGFLTGDWHLAWQGAKDIVAGIWEIIKGVVNAGISEVKTILSIGWDVIKGGFSAAWNGIAGIAHSIWNGIVSDFKWGVDQVIDLINGLVDQADKVLGFLHIALIPHVPRLEAGGVVGLAGGGTVGAGFTTNGPMAIVGEGDPTHPEYVIPTDPAHRKNALALYQSLGAQLMADGGILGDITNWLGGGATAAANAIVDRLATLIPAGLFRDIAAGVGHLAASGLNSLLGTVGAFFGPVGGSGVTQWTDMVLQALAIVGQPASLLQTVLRRMNQESGGNPFAINRTDSNWLKGTPSVGLMQVIGPTYQAYKMPGFDVGPYAYGSSENPLANTLASMRYAMSRYGSLPAAYNRPGGYDSGGLLPTGLSTVYNGTGRPEAVFTAKQMDALTKNKGQIVNVYVTQHSGSPQETGRAVALALRTVG